MCNFFSHFETLCSQLAIKCKLILNEKRLSEVFAKFAFKYNAWRDTLQPLISCNSANIALTTNKSMLYFLKVTFLLDLLKSCFCKSFLYLLLMVFRNKPLRTVRLTRGRCWLNTNLRWRKSWDRWRGSTTWWYDPPLCTARGTGTDSVRYLTHLKNLYLIIFKGSWGTETDSVRYLTYLQYLMLLKVLMRDSNGLGHISQISKWKY